MAYHLNFAVIWQNMPELWWGLALDLYLAFISLGIGCIIGLVAAFASVSKSGALRRIALGYVTLVRNLPILVIVLLVYFALPDVSRLFRLDKITSFVISLSLYAGAYLTEVFRGGLLAVPKGVVEAGMAIGLRPLQIKRHLIFPIMLRNALPSLGNNFISLFKDTSIASVIAVPELTYYATKINTETFRVVEAWSTAAVLYIATCYLIALVLRLVERRYARI
jgi:polar amino acid transport system permease protein